MSVRSRRLIIRPEARADMSAVLLYTRERWGAEQRRRYSAKLSQAMGSVLDHPERGRVRDELFLGSRSLPVEQHVIFYYLDENKIVVDRVLHGSQNVPETIVP